MSTTTTKPAKPSADFAGYFSPDSAVSRFVVAPVLFVSFLVSLFVIEKKTHDTVFASPHSHSTADIGQDPSARISEDFYHSHQRKLAKQEITDAFEMRNKVIAGFFMAGGVGIAAVSWGWMKISSLWVN